jgi:hypothetical protein
MEHTRQILRLQSWGKMTSNSTKDGAGIWKADISKIGGWMESNARMSAMKAILFTIVDVKHCCPPRTVVG